MTVNLNKVAPLPKPVETAAPLKSQAAAAPPPPPPPAPVKPVSGDAFQAAPASQDKKWSASFSATAPSLTGSTPATTEATFKGASVDAAQVAVGKDAAPATADADKAATVATDAPPSTAAVKMAENAVTKLTPLIPTAIIKAVVNSLNNTRNVMSEENRANGEWERSSQVVKQSEKSNCGAAAVATVASATGAEGVSNEQRMKELTEKYNTAGGATPAQVSDMLEDQGLKVTSGDATLDTKALDASLRRGGKAVVMVDSNQIKPNNTEQGPGTPHWVVVDGKNEEGEYLVKDPATGGSYYVSPEKLGLAMEATRESTGGGGMLMVEKRRSHESKDQTERASRENAEKIGNTSGEGSNAKGGARESSRGW